MDWEGDPDEPPPRRRLTGVVVLVAVVAVIGLLARSPATTPDPDADHAPEELAVEEASGAPTEPTEEPIEGLFGLDQVLTVREGRWEEVDLPPALPRDGERSDLSPATVWNGGELVVIDGTAVAAYHPATRTWRDLPAAPGQADSHRDAVLVDGVGLVVLERDSDTTTVGPTLWLLGPDEVWRQVADPPTARVTGVTSVQGRLVIAGHDPSGAASEIWQLAGETEPWEPLPPTPVPLLSAQPFETTAGLVVLGHMPEGREEGRFVPVAWLWSQEEQAWQRLADPPSHDLSASQPVTAPAIGMAGVSKDRILVLGGPDKRNLALSIYDVRADRWDERPLEVPPALAAELALPAFTATWDGQRTVWFQPVDPTRVLLALDLPTGVLDVVEWPEDAARHPRLVAFDSGIFLTGGEQIGPPDPASSRRIHRWTPDQTSSEPLVTPPPSPRPGIAVGGVGMLGLDEVLPVVDGAWQELVPPDGDEDPNVHRVSLWDGTEVVMVDTRSAQAYDPASDTWRSLPDLPLEQPEQGALDGVVVLEAVVVDGTVVVTDTVTVRPVPEEVGRSDAWALVGDRWQAVTSIPDVVELIGVADGQIISTRGSVRTPQPQLWRSDPTGSDPTELPPPPTAMQPTRVIDTPDGFVVLGSQLVRGAGSDDDPFVFEAAGLHWVAGAWETLDLPDMDLWGAAAVWVPVPPGRAQDPDPAGGLVIFGGGLGEPGVLGVAYDLATGDRTTIDVPVTEPEGALQGPNLAAAWDGADTVWIYGGYPSAIQLALDLPTGQLRVAAPTGGRVHADLHGDGEGLLLLGGFGPNGPIGTVHRWTPAPR